MSDGFQRDAFQARYQKDQIGAFQLGAFQPGYQAIDSTGGTSRRAFNPFRVIYPDLPPDDDDAIAAIAALVGD